MTYTFTEDEIKIFLDWSVYAQGKKAIWTRKKHK